MTGRRSALRSPWLLPATALGSIAVVRASVLDERDPYWQVRAGVENLAGAPLVRPDSWSWAPVAGDFTQTSPAWNDALGLAWLVAGFGGFFVLTLTSLLAYVVVVLALARRLGARPLPALAGALLCLLPALPMLSPRATLVAQTLFLAALLGADRLRRRLPDAPVAAVLVTVAVGGFVIAWAGMWLHLSWLLLAPALWLSMVVLLLATPAPTGRRLLAGVGGGGGLLAGVLTGPYGFDAWALSRAVQRACEGIVLEWAPATSAGLWLRWLPTVLLAVVIAGWVTRSVVRRWPHRGHETAVRLEAALLVLALPAALGGFLAIRFVGVGLLALAPLAAVGATRVAARVRERADAQDPTGPFRHQRVRFWSHGRPWRVVITLVVVLVSPLVLLAGATLGRPLALQAALPALPQGCRLLSDPAAAAPVLLLRPDVRVWIDTRADYWGRERNLEALEVLRSDDTAQPAVAGATCLLLDSSAGIDTSRIVAAVGADPAWTPAFDGGGVRVWVRG